ncbi:hypothetical protein Arno162_95 [Pectobacterium phage Arno162]|uniref:Uncharacterized protein n=1 Tax=Pectobacterium phage Arno162 TaxID=2500577 RepID=A0A679A2M8_9CAUD|nr:hypothetical protein Arno162_95 [Pectobacterium phage Arno162]
MAMTATGLQTLRYAEVLNNVKQSLFSDLSPNLDLSEDSAIGILLSTVCRQIADVYEVASEIYDSGIITKAEDNALDELCIINGTYRNLAKATFGLVEVNGTSGALISTNTNFRSTAGNIFNTRDPYTLTPSQCIGAELIVNSVHSGERYTVIIDNNTYTHTALVSDSPEDIIVALAAQVNSGLDMIATVRSDGTSEPTLVLNKDINNTTARTQVSVVTATTYLTFTQVTGLVTVHCTVTGAIFTSAGTVNSTETSTSGITSVYNRYDFTMGRDIETDTELRQRYLDNLVVTGVASSDAILQAVRRVATVSKASIEENDTEAVRNGIPPKSFTVTVKGGSDNDVAQAIWDTKPVGIRAFGTYHGTATDDDGGTHQIDFFRPTEKYAWVKLEWELDPENSPEVDVVQIPEEIAKAITAYGATLPVGGDIIPNKILRYVYASVVGIVVNTVRVAISSQQTAQPADADFVSTRILIDPTEDTQWISNQYIITQHV